MDLLIVLEQKLSVGASAGIITAAFVAGLAAGLAVYFKKIKK